MVVVGAVVFICQCGLINLKSPVPTKTKMEGVWQVTEAYDAGGTSILNKIQFPVVGFYLTSDNSVVSTAGPMTMYIVYGDSKYTQIASYIDQVFNYASLNFNSGGEWFIGGGEAGRFTLEMKLEGLPGQKSLTTLLNYLGIAQNYLDVVVYHKFQDVKVSFDSLSDTVMTWEFDDSTLAVYNTKDSYGNYVLWRGWPTDSFTRCRFVLTKRSKSLTDLVSTARTSP
jgi:hypothetical protein